MAVNNNLGDFLTDVADAIRSKKNNYIVKVVSNTSELNELMVERTNIGVKEGSSFDTQNNQSSVLVRYKYVFMYVKDSSDNESILRISWYLASDIDMGDFTFSEGSGGTLSITNNSGYAAFYSRWYPDETGQTPLWGISDGQSINLPNGETVNTGFYLQDDPFYNEVSVPAPIPINAQNFSTEIRNLPEGGDLYGDSVLAEPFTIDSGISQRPGPYDQDGYNYDPSISTPSSSSTVTKSLTKELTNYTRMYIIWNMIGSRNPYGDIYSKVTIDGNQTSLYEDYSNVINGDIVTEIDVSSVSGVQTITFTNFAYTRSSYRDFISQAITNVKGIYVK